MRLLERFALALGGLWALAVFIPAAFWYDAGRMQINDYAEGQQMELLYDGGPVREFRGSYAVTIRDADTLTTVGEDRSGVFTYKPGTVRPVPLTIEWWAPGNETFHNLPRGHYVMETCWRLIAPIVVIPDKVTCTTSNIFTVLPGGMAAPVVDEVTELKELVVGRTPAGWHRKQMAEWVQLCLVEKTECDPYQMPSYLARIAAGESPGD